MRKDPLTQSCLPSKKYRPKSGFTPNGLNPVRAIEKGTHEKYYEEVTRNTCSRSVTVLRRKLRRWANALETRLSHGLARIAPDKT